MKRTEITETLRDRLAGAIGIPAECISIDDDRADRWSVFVLLPKGHPADDYAISTLQAAAGIEAMLPGRFDMDGKGMSVGARLDDLKSDRANGIKAGRKDRAVRFDFVDVDALERKRRARAARPKSKSVNVTSALRKAFAAELGLSKDSIDIDRWHDGEEYIWEIVIEFPPDHPVDDLRSAVDAAASRIDKPAPGVFDVERNPSDRSVTVEFRKTPSIPNSDAQTTDESSGIGVRGWLAIVVGIVIVVSMIV